MTPKQPPHSIEAEQSVLGGLMLSSRAWMDVSGKLTPKDFYRTDHQVIFAAVMALLEARKTCDFLTVTEYLRDRGLLEDAGGATYIGTLAGSGSVANIVSYAELVRERSVLRALIAVGAELGDLGYNTEGKTAAALIEEAERLVYGLRGRGEGGVMRSYADYVTQAEHHIERQHAKGGGMGGISTGFIALDRKTDGLHPGDLVVIAGNPGSGKTTLAMNIVENAAELELRSVVFSMEMPGHQVALRSIAGAARVSLSKLRGGNLDEHEYGRISAVGGSLRTDRVLLDETGALSPVEIRARARRAARDGLKLIVVDYIQLMQVPGTRENRTNQVSEITRSLKALAKELGVTVIALSQLSRDNAKENRRPRLSDLRDSGGIEQDADLVLFVHREQVKEEDEGEAGHSGPVEIIIGKQRNGPCGHVRLSYRGEFCRFDNLSEEDAARVREKPVREARGFRKPIEDGKARAAGEKLL